MLLDQVIPRGALKAAIEDLIKLKSEGAELSYGARIPVISKFIEKELARLEENREQYENNAPPVEVLDDLFRQGLRKAWGIRLE